MEALGATRQDVARQRPRQGDAEDLIATGSVTTFRIGTSAKRDTMISEHDLMKLEGIRCILRRARVEKETRDER